MIKKDLRAWQTQNEITVEELWRILVKRKLTFVSTLAVTVLVALIISLVLPTRYEGVGRLSVDLESPHDGAAG